MKLKKINFLFLSFFAVHARENDVNNTKSRKKLAVAGKTERFVENTHERLEEWFSKIERGGSDLQKISKKIY